MCRLLLLTGRYLPRITSNRFVSPSPILPSSAYPVATQNQHALILCIINGDELVFNREFMIQGYQGGRAAAQQLTQRIAAQLSSEEVHVYGRLSFWITIYFNKAELAEDLSASNICPLEQFHSFVTVSCHDCAFRLWPFTCRLRVSHTHRLGLQPLTQVTATNHWTPKYRVSSISQAICFNSTLDRISSDIHILAPDIACLLWRFVPFHQPPSLKIHIVQQPGYDPSTHMGLFSALDRDDILGKISLLYPSQPVADSVTEMPNPFTLPRLILDGLFLPEKPPRAPKKLAPLTTGSYSSVTSNGGLISPQSPDRSPGRPIDPSLVSLFACFLLSR